MKNKSLFFAKLSGLAAFFYLALAGSVLAGEVKAACVFASIDNNAWIIHKDSTVKSSLNVGDVLRDGDRVIVNHGNRVQLAFDQDCRNIAQIEGDASFTLNSAQPAVIDLKNGRIFAVLDNLPPNSEFSIETPTAVGAVRGTQYQVNAAGEQSNFMVYRGEVLVSGRDKDGNPTLDNIILPAGQKTSVIGIGQAPKAAENMSDSEKNEIGQVIQNIDKTRQTVDSKQMKTWFNESSVESGESEKTQKFESSEKSKSKYGKVVI